ncbi:MAG TPA: T9SS type A sorting domain-containing protein, partial [Rubricoccaceae bacterium]|nr:T9SS type A sorting domain-containing protein [Rubricoccaceae bacterium]
LPTPAPLSPPDSALFVGTPPWLTWTPVAGARHYAVRLSTGAVLTTDSTSVQARNLPVNEVHTISWTVQAFGVGAQSLPSAPRTFIYYRYEAEWAGGGAGIMETAHPVQPPCPDPGDPGCDAFGGNTVWHDENVSDDYYLTAFDGTGFEAGSIQRIAPFFEAAAPDDYEVRFTANGGLAVYVFATAGNNRVARVPFELWNVGDPADPADDVRMIPALLLPAGQSYLTDWTNQFPGTDPWTAGPRSRITQPVYFFMPDRPDGYARFEQDALAFGGAGAVYHPNADGDTQVDINPATGQPCPNQHYYVNFCYEGAGNRVYTIGRLAFADLANDGTTPPPGTIIRFAITDPEIVGNEPEPGGAPLAFVLGAPYPNPFNPRAVVPFELSEPGAVRLTVVDVLGREVAMLANGLLPAGRHTATLDGARLASGVYVVVLDAGGQRHTRKVLLVK